MGNKKNTELDTRLLKAQSAEEVADLLRANGQEYSAEEAGQIWQEIERYKADLNQAGKEEAVFNQDVSPEELENVAGGIGGTDDNDEERVDIYGGKGFPNCKATVEDGSWCRSNDACHFFAVHYVRRKECSKAWR